MRLPAGRRRRMPRLRFGRSEAPNPKNCSKPTASISLICRRCILWKALFTCVPAPHFNCYATRTALGAGSPSSASCPYPSPTSATTSSPRIGIKLGGDYPPSSAPLSFPNTPRKSQMQTHNLSIPLKPKPG